MFYILTNGILPIFGIAAIGYFLGKYKIFDVSAAGTIGVGTFSFGEIITGQSSLSTAFVTSWNAPSLTLTARNLAGDFSVGELIVDNEGSAYRLHSIDYDDNDANNSGDDIQVEADSILNFTEKNPFGEV